MFVYPTYNLIPQTYVGTSAYMSPERIKNQPYSFASDIWSLGLSILELGTGQFPYDTSQGPMNMMLQVGIHSNLLSTCF